MLGALSVASPTLCTSTSTALPVTAQEYRTAWNTYHLRTYIRRNKIAKSCNIKENTTARLLYDALASTAAGHNLTSRSVWHSCGEKKLEQHIDGQVLGALNTNGLFVIANNQAHTHKLEFIGLSRATTQLHHSGVVTQTLVRANVGKLDDIKILSAMPRMRANTTSNDANSEAAQSSSQSAWPPPPPPLAPGAIDSSSLRDSEKSRLPMSKLPSIRFVPHHDHRSSRPSLSFPPVSRILPDPSSVIRVGRYSDRDNQLDTPPNIPSAAPVGFKSKVVSRRHCEFFFKDSQWYIKDVKSSSGTFLNHIHLSRPGMESRPFPIKDGDVVQLGIDFKGGEEMIFRCVKMLVFCTRGSQKEANNFNKSAHKRLQILAKGTTNSSEFANSSTECTICLNAITPCQALFVAPCSHTWHYKCIRPLLEDPTHPSFRYPHFLCPNCRAIADLEADVDEPISWEEESEIEQLEQTDEQNITPSLSKSQSNLERDSLMHEGNINSQASFKAGATTALSSQDVSTSKTHNSVANITASASTSAKLSSTAAATAAPQLTLEDHLFHQGGNSVGGWLSNAEASTSRAPPQSNISNWATPVRLHSAVADILDVEMENGTATANIGDGTPAGASLHPSLLGLESPLTPRNNAGPFVLDGGAGAIPDSIEREMSG